MGAKKSNQAGQSSWRQLNDPFNPENRAAGIAADLIKHTVYGCVLKLLAESNPSLTVHECHAGRGMYRVAEGPRQVLLEQLRDAPLAIMKAQRRVQEKLGCWPQKVAPISWYAGSALLTADALGESARCHYYEWDVATREVLRRSLYALKPRPECHIEGGEQCTHDGEIALAQLAPTLPSRTLVLMDPFCIWERPKLAYRRERYAPLLERLSAGGVDAVLFFVWPERSTSRKGYQAFEDQLTKRGRQFIKVEWRAPLPCLMWVLVRPEALNEMERRLNECCNTLFEYLPRNQLARQPFELRIHR